MKVCNLLFMFILLLYSCRKENNNNIHESEILIDSVLINNFLVSNEGTINNIDFDKVLVKIKFKTKVDTTLFNKSRLFFTGNIDTLYAHKFDKSSTTLVVLHKKD